MVFVLDRDHQPLMPCTPKRARLLLARKRAVVHQLMPFVIRLKDRQVQESVLQPVVLKLDPGSKTTGMALVREEDSPEGLRHHGLHLAELAHRGQAVHEALRQRAQQRRRRRNVNLRHRPVRFHNRRRPLGWLPPSLRSRIGNTLTWSRRYQRLTPLVRLEIEHAKFDTQLLQNPQISPLAYQSGTLVGWEMRSYLLEKWNRRCGYCGQTNVAFEVDHIHPRSRGGSNRISNLVLACHACNAAKGNQTAAEFGHPQIQTQAQHPLRDAAVVNATRYALLEQLRTLGLPVATWSGGRTHWNRNRFGITKTHALDALCVGEPTSVVVGGGRTLHITAMGRGRYGRTLLDAYGFPRGYLMAHKRVRGFQTGDLVVAIVPEPLKARGIHKGRVAVRAKGSFRIGHVDSIPARYCRLLQRADGYSYALV